MPIEEVVEKRLKNYKAEYYGDLKKVYDNRVKLSEDVWRKLEKKIQEIENPTKRR